jgi:hypothetical protein
MKTYGGVHIQIIVGDEWSASRTCRFTPSPSRMNFRYSLTMRFIGPYSRFGLPGGDKNFALLGIELRASNQ